MASNTPPQPRCLTLTELVFGYGLVSGIGYGVGGKIGVLCGAVLLTARYAQLILLAAYPPESDGGADRNPSKQPDPHG